MFDEVLISGPVISCPFIVCCSRIHSYYACHGRSSLHIFAVTDVLPRIIIFNLTAFTKQSLYCSRIINTECIKMIGAVWKLIIFTSMVKRLINTSRNERVTLQVYDTCLQTFLFFGLRRKDCLTRSTLSSDTHGRPALFPLKRHPFV